VILQGLTAVTLAILLRRFKKIQKNIAFPETFTLIGNVAPKVIGSDKPNQTKSIK